MGKITFRVERFREWNGSIVFVIVISSCDTSANEMVIIRTVQEPAKGMKNTACDHQDMFKCYELRLVLDLYRPNLGLRSLSSDSSVLKVKDSRRKGSKRPSHSRRDDHVNLSERSLQRRTPSALTLKVHSHNPSCSV